MESETLGGLYTFAGETVRVRRVGYGAMQLAGPGVFGPPKDRVQAVAVLRKAVESGVDHIDTSDFYGPHVTNQIIREALHPYPNDLLIVTKVGCIRGADGSWPPAFSREDLTRQVHDNLRNLGLERLPVVNLRARGDMGALEPPLTVLADLRDQGLIEHIGVSGVTFSQIATARAITPVVCVQNAYNVANRSDDALIDELAGAGIAYVPFFPLGGFNRLQSSVLDAVAAEHDVTALQVAQAWLLQRAPNILLICGTSSVAHLNENLAVGEIELTPEALVRLNAIAGPREGATRRQPSS